MTPDGNAPDGQTEPPPQEHGHDLGFPLPPPAKLTKGRAVVISVVVLGLIAAAFVAAYLPNRRARAALEEKTASDDRAATRVEVVTPVIVPSDHPIVLPGSIRPLEETVVYSRANGYVRHWLADIGDKVTEGQLLAELETPELDQELLQARAQLAQAQASVAQAMATHAFSKSNLERYKRLTPQGLASEQDLDQKQAQASVDEANVTVAKAAAASQQANINRLSSLKSFAHVVAPFAGTVTSRSIDRGSLVTAGSTTPLFHIVATDPARVFVQVPQGVAPSVRADIPASVTVREYGGRVFPGKVTRSAGALDPATRTMNTEVRVPNPKGELLAGMYAEVAITLPNPHPVLELPSTALVNDAKGLRVAVVGDDNVVRLVKVVLERDTGSTVLISSGLSGGEQVVKLPSAGLEDGSVVEVIR